MYLVDNTESRSTIPKKLNSLNIKTEFTSLPVGDYLVVGSSIVGNIESKTAGDFISSISNKQLEKEIFNMCYNYDRSILAVHGNIVDALVHRKMKRETLFNFMAGIAVRTTELGTKGTVSIINFLSDWDFVMFLKTFHNLIVSDDIYREPPGKKFKSTPGMEKEFSIQSWPDIGPKRAKEFKEKFGTIKNFVNASKEDLMEMKGIGKKLTDRTWRHSNEN